MELQTTKPLTPSLSHHSFCRRQRLAQDRHRSQLAALDSAAAIISYGCKLLDCESDLLQVFVWCAAEILGEAQALSAAGSAGSKETVVRNEAVQAGRQSWLHTSMAQRSLNSGFRSQRMSKLTVGANML